jgi:hypothetical protein
MRIKLLLFGLLICGLSMGQSIVNIRGVSRIVYGGDTCDMYFSGDTMIIKSTSNPSLRLKLSLVKVQDIQINGTITHNDSIIDTIYSGTIPNTDYVNGKIADYAEIDTLVPAADSALWADKSDTANYSLTLTSDANSNTTGGTYSGVSITNGIGNSLFGYASGAALTTGDNNTYIGNYAAPASTGNDNTIIGAEAGHSLTTGNGNVLIGRYAGSNLTSQSNRFIVNNFDRNDLLGDMAKSLLYGVFDDDTLNQSLKVNGLLNANSLSVVTSASIGKGLDSIGLSPETGIRLYGAATQWTDVAITGFHVTTATNAPTFTTGFSGSADLGAWYYQGSVQDDIAYFNLQIPHGVVDNDTLSVHFHWSPTTTPGTVSAVFLFTYQFADINGTFSTPATTTITIPLTGLVQWRHYLTNLYLAPTGTGSLSRIWNCSLKRLANSDANDNYTDNIGLISIDAHARIEGFGSNNMTGE